MELLAEEFVGLARGYGVVKHPISSSLLAGVLISALGAQGTANVGMVLEVLSGV